MGECMTLGCISFALKLRAWDEDRRNSIFQLAFPAFVLVYESVDLEIYFSVPAKMPRKQSQY